jgi:alkanesulfonate monooxygenase SsuD/methylene tetrahydromethanopterin reductase-like flavin-dependent oxidoreductase (luciferase family)
LWTEKAKRSTERIQLRAGSVVLPLHHPIRVAEEWALVDKLSKGRVGISFASGWHPNDFVFAPHSFGHHRELMFQEIETVPKLWRVNSSSRWRWTAHSGQNLGLGTGIK